MGEKWSSFGVAAPVTGTEQGVLLQGGANVRIPIALLGGITDPTAAEIANSVPTPNLQYKPGNILRYIGSGVTDISVALAGALLCNALVYYPGVGPYFHGQLASFLFNANYQRIKGDGPETVLQFQYAAGDNLQATGLEGIVVSDCTIEIIGTGPNTYIGAFALRAGCTYCRAENVTITGVSGCGVYIGGSSNNRVRNCNFASFQGTNADQADVYIGQLAGSFGSDYNLVDGCQGFGGGWHGITIQTNNPGVPPCRYNQVVNNHWGEHVCYGMADYSGAAVVDQFNSFIGNYVENIQGTALSGKSGAGMYNVGAGGTIIANNTFRNCCVQTTTVSLAPGAIGIADVCNEGVTAFGTIVAGSGYVNSTYVGVPLTGGTGALCTATVVVAGGVVTSVTLPSPGNFYTVGDVLTTSNSNLGGSGSGFTVAVATVATLSPITVSGNHISGMTKYYGMYATQCGAGIAFTGNTILHPAANTTGNPICLVECSNIAILGGAINCLSTEAAILSKANASNVFNIVINGVQIQHAGVGIQFYTSGTFTHSQVAVSGCQLNGASNNIDALYLLGATFTGNNCTTGAATSAVFSNCIQTRLSNNRLTCTGTYALSTAGTCTNSYCDDSNLLSASGSVTGLNAVNNAGTGFFIQQLGIASPSQGTQVAGDTVRITTGVTNIMEVCTTGGSPGTFTPVPV